MHFSKMTKLIIGLILRVSFTKQGKLARFQSSMDDLLATCKLKNTDTTSNLHIDQRNIPSTGQFSIVTNKEATVCYKEPEAKKWRVARSFNRPGIVWLLDEASKSSFISWSKLKITWIGKQYIQIMCSSSFPNKWIRVEKILSLLILSVLCGASSSNNNCSHFKRKIV